MSRALTIKQRRFVKHYVESGNATQAALIAYDTTNPHTASAIAAETLEKPGVQQAVADLLDAHGLSDAKLAAIHAHYLALYQSPDPQVTRSSPDTVSPRFTSSIFFRSTRSARSLPFSGAVPSMGTPVGPRCGIPSSQLSGRYGTGAAPRSGWRAAPRMTSAGQA